MVKCGSIPQLAVYTTDILYTTYILPSGGLYATYHLLREPETTIDSRIVAQCFKEPGILWIQSLLAKLKKNSTNIGGEMFKNYRPPPQPKTHFFYGSGQLLLGDFETPIIIIYIYTSVMFGFQNCQGKHHQTFGEHRV